MKSKDNKEMNNSIIENFNKEDCTQNMEFISSYFKWKSLSKQKERAKELDDMTKNDKNERKK